MKLNKKGFMLAEVVIVASVIATVLISIYILLNKVSSNYETRNRYNDIDAMYVAMEINDIIKGGNFNSTDNYIELNNNNFITFYDNATGYTTNAWYVKNINNFTNNDNILGDYIGYIKDRLEGENYNYLVIVEIKKGNDNNCFYTLKVGENNAS